MTGGVIYAWESIMPLTPASFALHILTIDNFQYLLAALKCWNDVSDLN